MDLCKVVTHVLCSPGPLVSYISVLCHMAFTISFNPVTQDLLSGQGRCAESDGHRAAILASITWAWVWVSHSAIWLGTGQIPLNIQLGRVVSDLAKKQHGCLGNTGHGRTVPNFHLIELKHQICNTLLLRYTQARLK